MIEILICFIGTSLWLCVLLGGADYGAGILELLPAGVSREAQKKVINQAIGPVWEAKPIALRHPHGLLFQTRSGDRLIASLGRRPSQGSKPH